MDNPPHGIPFPLRDMLELHQELHARPALPARSPCVVSYWVNAGMAAARAQQALTTICLASGAAKPAADVRHHVLHGGGFSLKYERHGEFVSWQVNRPLPAMPNVPSDEVLRQAVLASSALDALPAAFVAHLSGPDSGQLLAAAHVVLVRGSEPTPTADRQTEARLLRQCQALLAAQAGPGLGDMANNGEGAAPVMGAYIGDGQRAALLTHLRLGPDGFARFLVLDFGLDSDQAAREAQRLCEIEAYRMLAMQGFPLAQRASASLAELERQLLATVDTMAHAEPGDEGTTFDSLSQLAAAVEHSTASTRYRFSATQAYHRIVEARLGELREQRIAGVQTLSGFLRRRFAPAMAFCASTDSRLTDVADRINRAVGLARVRLEARREAGNQQLFRALAQRQKQQLQLQQTVEGLSVVAISYYALGLVGYIAKAAKSLAGVADWMPTSEVVVGAAVVPIFLGVGWFVHKLRLHTK